MHANNVCHFAVQADDVERARAFYENTFGWIFKEWGPPEFYLIQTGTSDYPGINGALQKRTKPVGSGCNGFECSITVSDIKKTKAEILKHGGQVIHDEFEIPTVGVIVKFSDTEGNIACLIQYSDGSVATN